MTASRFIFRTPLEEGVIIRRDSRFTMTVETEDGACPCHCPATGRVGDIELDGRPCLLSRSSDPLRKTRFTVEAISLDRPEDGKKSWIGINQNAVNRYVEHYILNGGLSDMVGECTEVRREQFLGSSKLDFLVGDVFLEVKTPLQILQTEHPSHVKRKKALPLTNTDRLIRHITGLADSLRDRQRAILLTVFVYDNPGFRAPKKTDGDENVRSAVERSVEAGVELWQANFSINAEGVALERCFRLAFEDVI
ncbi:MAG: DNA/RNA nuclease SfsA [Candidatus Methanoplasma sp.]|jgi:sugar fermentation stimulation protein A|nr:DNA/RNA nuclease SfsA [Candidatus Methanoplasma sp.]